MVMFVNDVVAFYLFIFSDVSTLNVLSNEKVF